MDKYAIYTYEETDAPPIEGELWEEGGNNLPAEGVGSKKQPTEKLEWLFGGTGTEFRVQREAKRGGADKFPCTVLAHDHHVALLRLENVKSVAVYVKSQAAAGTVAKIDKQDITSSPYCYVIIDFNPLRRLIAIQVDSDSWRKTETVRALLEESINDFLNKKKMGFNLRILSKMQTQEFWDYSNYRIKKEHRSLSKMTIYFDKGKLDPRVEALVKQSPYLRSLMKDLWGGSHGELTIFDPVGTRVIDQRKHDIENLVAIIMSDIPNSKFGLKMTYDDGIAYTCGKAVQVEMPLDLQYLINFQTKTMTLEDTYQVEWWLDNVIEQTKGFKDVETTKRKPSRKGKKRIS